MTCVRRGHSNRREGRTGLGSKGNEEKSWDLWIGMNGFVIAKTPDEIWFTLDHQIGELPPHRPHPAQSLVHGVLDEQGSPTYRVVALTVYGWQRSHLSDGVVVVLCGNGADPPCDETLFWSYAIERGDGRFGVVGVWDGRGGFEDRMDRV